MMSSLRHAWSRITVNRTTFAFVFLSFLYFILQTAFAIQSSLINTAAAETIKQIYSNQSIGYLDFVDYSSRSGAVRVCSTNEQALDYRKCPIVWPPSLATNSTAKSAPSKRDLNIQRVADNDKGQQNVLIAGLKEAGAQNDTITATSTCLQVMKWPLSTLLNRKREDVTFVFFQGWVFGLGVVAVINQSVPHVIASFITHLLVALWSGYDFLETVRFQADYDLLVRGINAPANYTGQLGKPGACDGQDFLPNYFGPRKAAQLAVAIINVVGLLASIVFTYKLFHSFGWESFKRVGASVLINRLYKISLSFLILIQLGLFFTVAAVGLWLDQLYNGVFGTKGQQIDLYKANNVIVFLLLIPWFILGWRGVRLEKRKTLMTFIVISFLFVLSWIAQCFSESWRLTFQYWSFFAAMQTCAFALTFAAFVMAIVCRIKCFGRGLDYFLQGYFPDASGDLNPAPDVVQRSGTIAFPSLQALGDEEQGQAGVGSPHHRSDSETTLTDIDLATGKSREWRQKENAKRFSLDTLPGEEDAVELPVAPSYNPRDPPPLPPRPVATNIDDLPDWGHIQSRGPYHA